jgi:hypothetical protein
MMIRKTLHALKELVPIRYIENIFKTAERASDSGKLIVLSVAADPKSPYFWKGLGTFASEITKEEYDK